MNHSVVVGNLSNFLAPIAYLQANHSNIPFTLAEVGSSLNPSGNNYDLQGVLGSALWTIDFMLYAMSIVRHPSLPHCSTFNCNPEYHTREYATRRRLRLRCLAASRL